MPGFSPLSDSALSELLKRSMPSLSRLKIRKIEIVGEFKGEGSFGCVVKGKHVISHKTVAVKILKEKGPEHHGDWLNEARIIGSLDHENLIAIYDADVNDDGFRYLVMEWVEGQSLRRKMIKGRPLAKPRLCADLVMRLAQAVTVIHDDAGFAHCDLKPENIMVPAGAAPSRFEKAKIVDFGLARPKHLQAPVGTEDYSPPNDLLDARTPPDISPRDVFALGILLHECLTGILPVPASPMIAIPDKTLAAICKKCMTLNPQQRIKARKLAEDLKNYLGHFPTEARPLNAIQRFGLWLWREWKLASLLSIGIIALAVMIVLSILLNGEITEVKKQTSLREKEYERRLEMTRKLAIEEYRSRIKGYASQLFKVQQLIEKNNPTRALAELDQCHLSLQDLEWRYLKALCHGSLRSFDLGKPIQSLAVSPDGREIAVALKGGEIHVGAIDQDWATYKPTFRERPERHIEQMLLRPPLLVTSSTSKLENVAAGIVDFHWLPPEKPPREPIRDVFLPRFGEDTLPATTRLALHKDGPTVVAPTIENQLRVFDLDDPSVESRFSTGFETLGLAFSADGSVLATVGQTRDHGGEVHFWDWPTRKLIQRVQARQTGLAFAPKGSKLVTFSPTTITPWERSAGIWVMGKAQTPMKGIRTLAFHPKWPGLLAIAGGEHEAELYLWEIDRTDSLFPLRGHHAPIIAIAFGRASDNRIMADEHRIILISGDEEGMVHVWHGEPGRAKTPEFFNATARRVSSADGKLEASVADDHSVQWNFNAEDPIGNISQSRSFDMKVFGLAERVIGKRLVVRTEKGHAVVDLVTAELLLMAPE
jgi:serine/threonine protein kinase/WD40 repeat protein